MLNKNFINIISSIVSNDSVAKVKQYNGTVENQYITGTNALALLRAFTTTKRSASSSRISGFTIGSGTTSATLNDYALETDIDETNFSIMSSNIIPSIDYNSTPSSATFTQVWKYNGETEITINEIAFWANYYWNSASRIFIIDRTVLDSPITVNNGDTFTIAMTIGGKATVTVNS